MGAGREFRRQVDGGLGEAVVFAFDRHALFTDNGPAGPVFAAGEFPLVFQEFLPIVSGVYCVDGDIEFIVVDRCYVQSLIVDDGVERDQRSSWPEQCRLGVADLELGLDRFREFLAIDVGQVGVDRDLVVGLSRREPLDRDLVPAHPDLHARDSWLNRDHAGGEAVGIDRVRHFKTERGARTAFVPATSRVDESERPIGPTRI